MEMPGDMYIYNIVLCILVGSLLEAGRGRAFGGLGYVSSCGRIFSSCIELGYDLN